MYAVPRYFNMATIYRHWFPCTITPENPHGKGYVGYTYRTLEKRDKQRFRPSQNHDSVALKRAVVKYGKENMQTDIIEEILPIHSLVCERERHWIAHFDDFHNGYNLTEGGDGIPPEITSEANRRRVKDGTHHLLGGEIQRETNRRRVEDGTHHLLGDNNPSHRRVKDGTHNFLDSEFQSKNVRKRVEDGTFHKLRENNPNARPEYYQAYWEFILSYPLGIKEVRKHLREKFGHVSRWTRNAWISKWQAELEDSRQPTTKED